MNPSCRENHVSYPSSLKKRVNWCVC